MRSIPSLLRVAAVGVGALAVVVAVTGWVVLDGVELITSSGAISPRTFTTLEETLEVSVEATGTIHDALEEMDGLIESAATSSRTTAGFVAEVADLTSTRIPESIDAVERAMPGLIDAGAVIHDTLTTLSFLGVDYRPEVPFDDALRDIHVSLDGLSDDVARQGTTLRALVPEISRMGDTASALAGRIRETRSQVAEAQGLLDDYRAILADTETAVGSYNGSLGATPLGRGLFVAIGALGLLLGAVIWRLASAWQDPATPSHIELREHASV